MKKLRSLIAGAGPEVAGVLALVPALWLGACKNIVGMEAGEEAVAGSVVVTIALSEKAASDVRASEVPDGLRFTLIPAAGDMAGWSYSLSFEDAGSTHHTHADVDITAGSHTATVTDIDVGKWNITATGRNAGGTEVATGTARNVDVTAAATSVSILMGPKAGGNGTLGYNITLPSGVTGGTFTINKGNTAVDGTPVALAAGANSGTITLPAGGYHLVGSVTGSGGGTGGTEEIAHIYSGCTTQFEWAPDDDELNNEMISDLDLTEYVHPPVTGAAIVTTIDAPKFTGSIVWTFSNGDPVPAGSGSVFEAGTVYKAAVSLTPKDGYTFAGVVADSFTHSGAASVTNVANSGNVTIVFNKTAGGTLGEIGITIGFDAEIQTDGIKEDGAYKIYKSGTPQAITFTAVSGAWTDIKWYVDDSLWPEQAVQNVFVLNASGVGVNEGTHTVKFMGTATSNGLPYSCSIQVIVVGQSETPAATVTDFTKTSAVQAAADFTLTNTPALAGTWKVYSAASGDTPAAGITAAITTWPTLRLRHATDIPAGTYHVTVTETGRTESGRLELTVNDFVDQRYHAAGFYSGTGTDGAGGTLVNLDGQTGTTVIDKAVAWLTSNAAANTSYTLSLDTGIPAQTAKALGDTAFHVVSGVTLFITTPATTTTPVTVTLSGSGSLFTLSGSNAKTLVLEGAVILAGTEDNTAALVTVSSSASALQLTGNAKITGNTNPSGNGGGVKVEGGTFTMNGGEVSGNSAGSGGGVYVLSSAFTMNGGEVSGNSGSGSGGGVYVTGSGSMFTMTGGGVSGNEADIGGGVYVTGSGAFTMNDGEVSNNTAALIGGGMYVYNNGTVTMKNGAITGNSADGNGGGMYLVDSVFTMEGGAITGNSAGGSGGGMYVDDAGLFTMKGGRIQGSSGSAGYEANTAVTEGAALFKTSGGTAVFGTGGGYVGSASKAGGEAIGTTEETITAPAGAE